MSQTVNLEHPTLNVLYGKREPHLNEVDQFRGIQYAKLADRFARGTLIAEYPPITDAAVFGPLPVANPIGCDLEQILLQHTLEHIDFSFSDTECLTLNISVPSSRDSVNAPLPVLAFLHGGGYVTGSASFPQWELDRLVGLSVKAGKPIIAVGINYRLGPFGFLTSAAMRQAGYRANNGLHDQKLALRWIQKHIGGFGGDPSKVTVLGSSMGGASGFIHLQSDEPLFHQLIAMGGNGLMRPAPIEAAEVAFGLATKAFGLETLSPSEQVQELVRVPADELLSKLDEVHAPTLCVVDGEIAHHMATYEAMADPAAVEKMFPGIKWCKTLWMGDCQLDGMITTIMGLGGRPDNLTESLTHYIKTALPSHNTASILTAYGIDSSKADNLPAIIDFMQDIGWSQAARACAQAWCAAPGNRSFLTHFNVPNPWPGAWQGRASHALDLAFALQNYNEFMNAGQKACAERMGRDLVAFVSDAGAMPFPEFGGGGSAAMVYLAGSGEGDKDESRVVEGEEAEGLGRRGKLYELGLEKPEVLDGLLNAWTGFIQGPPE